MAGKKTTMIEREGRKSYDGLSDDEVMAQRLVDSAELEYLWQVIADIYGKKVAKAMRELLPADPLFFKDYFVYGWLKNGKTESEIQEMLDSYTHKDWERELDECLPSIKKMLRVVRRNTKFVAEESI